ncbi:dicarboxylate/amino acid:cation symporter [Laribacter hongkongensis]|uniref:Dicarboxylate/amino acid:cation symporter n=1 Tax=Laribacter hongkongensis TaxID=168471 RepID=A0ABD4SPX4_9NEIS|nr:dicarboxylate/amino acid:cation symporter [Laribacter hongkongensis]MCG9025242.1 dicarboxylate/amino acid:cation symporter [Laribacter hongkongensis]MCG9065172.1 dicarboxylate/amino acid:cation symporter [Laribacter hongkongensis]MCG9099891.1 dicarboxylate/amino acid:cation symporter [Laribacter hongkongensis]MCG9103307.1 dicarboxylate/amino acid:cation symporter [Laribacter hongkongensis]MCG9111369.1 dicarboxylate/amino acid:cation symporter [Laribacter hongkongensis]
MQSKRLTLWILFALVAGVVSGYVIHHSASGWAHAFAGYISLLTDIFLRLIKMIIAPLVFSTLVVGIARMGDSSTIGRVGIKTFGWFIFMTVISLSLGLVMVNLLKPGVGLNLPLPDVMASSGVSKGSMSLKDFLHHAFPTSIFDAMARNEILQIVVFSLFFGVAAAALGKKGEALIADLDMVSHIMLRVTTYIMNFAPVAVFAAVAAVIAENGVGILVSYGKFMLSFYAAMLILWAIIIGFGLAVVGGRTFALVRTIREPILLAFSTASSEAAYPKTLEQLERFGCSNRIASFVLPIGYSFNLDGSMLYATFGSIFIAQAYGIHLTFWQEILMLLMLMVTSKGMAGVPRASLVVIAATLGQFDIPEAGLLLLLGVDHFLDMGRSATNVLGNAVATAIVSKWEGQLHRHGGGE